MCVLDQPLFVTDAHTHDVLPCHWFRMSYGAHYCNWYERIHDASNWKNRALLFRGRHNSCGKILALMWSSVLHVRLHGFGAMLIAMLVRLGTASARQTDQADCWFETQSNYLVVWLTCLAFMVVWICKGGGGNPPVSSLIFRVSRERLLRSSSGNERNVLMNFWKGVLVDKGSV